MIKLQTLGHLIKIKGGLMNDNYRNLLNLCAFALETKTDFDELSAREWVSLFDIIKRQGMVTTLYPAMKALPRNLAPGAEILNMWQQIVQRLSIQRLLYDQNVSIVLEALQRAGIDAIVLKGLAIARFYKLNEYRIMSDLDIFATGEQLHAAQAVLEQMGYSCEDDEKGSLLHYSFHKLNCVTVELHRNFVHSGFLGKREDSKWIEHIWSNKSKISSEGLAFFAMAPEDELVNQIVHFGTHFVHVGVKLQHLYDMALIVKSCGKELEWDYIANILKSLGFYRFAQVLLTACSKYFFVEVPEHFVSVDTISPEQFIGDLLEFYSVEKTPGDWQGWLTITTRFSFLYKNSLLHPLASILEFMAQIKVHGLKFPFVLTNSRRNIMISKRKIKILKSFW